MQDKMGLSREPRRPVYGAVTLSLSVGHAVRRTGPKPTAIRPSGRCTPISARGRGRREPTCVHRYRLPSEASSVVVGSGRARSYVTRHGDPTSAGAGGTFDAARPVKRAGPVPAPSPPDAGAFASDRSRFFTSFESGMSRRARGRRDRPRWSRRRRRGESAS